MLIALLAVVAVRPIIGARFEAEPFELPHPHTTQSDDAPAVLAAAGGDGSHEADQDQLEWVVDQLKLLPALEKPHLGREACWFMGAALQPLQRQLLREYARVLRAVGYCGYYHESDGNCSEVNIVRSVDANFTTMM